MPPRSGRATVLRKDVRTKVVAPAAVQPAALPYWVRWALLGLAGLFLLYIFTSEAGDPDMWWHLKTGQYIVQNHKLPVPDPFGWTTYLTKLAYPGEEVTRDFNLTHEWLSQAVFYSAYATG